MLGVRIPPGLPGKLQYPCGGQDLLEKLKLNELKEFFGEVRLEMRKVSWPGRKEVYGTTVVVIFAVFFFGIYLGIVDLVLKLGVDNIFRLFR
jgi:preprotein translocase subunit SecE